MNGRKDDAGKPRWDLVPWGCIYDVVKVLTLGAEKYDAHNWQKVPNPRERYFSAAQRHLVAWWEGERMDPETGENHLAHALCCILFLLWFDRRREVELALELAAKRVVFREDQP